MANIKDLMSFKPTQNYIDDGKFHGLLSPFEPGTRVLEKGWRVAEGFAPMECDIIFEKDVAVKLRDGVTIYTDIYRPKDSTEKIPVILAWSPYGKSGGTAPRTVGLYKMLGIEAKLSGLARFEGPDPAWWCARGYAICNPDPRGIAHSEGDATLIGTEEAKDVKDVIEWVATQEWCNGRVGMTGTSYLTFTQWFVAAEQPEHLCCINAHEGLSDAYRDLMMVGGMPDLGFVDRLQWNHSNANPACRREDYHEEVERFPYADAEIWQDKIVRFEDIKVPALVVASYSNSLHTNGTFRAWRRMASKEKWLRIHNTQEWPDYYSEAAREDRLRFFDYYLKGEKNGWEQTPVVRYALLDMEGGDTLDNVDMQFPPQGAKSEKFYLDARTQTLITDIPASAQVTYNPHGDVPKVSFIKEFNEQIVMAGYPSLHLFVSADDADDMDLFILVQKLDNMGNALSEFTVPGRSAKLHDFTEHGASILRYKGPNGMLRVSARHLDDVNSTDKVPQQSFDRTEKLEHGQVVEVVIPLSPVGMMFYPGESLRLVVSGENLIGSMMPSTANFVPKNGQSHTIYTGEQHPSYLQMPVVKK